MAYKGEASKQEALQLGEEAPKQEFEPSSRQVDEEVAKDQGEYVAPDPSKNPRNQALAEIAKAAAARHVEDAAETVPSIDDEGNITQPAAAQPAQELEKPAAPAAEATAEPAKTPGIDPAAEYEVEIDGQKVKVPGQKIIDAGFRTYQKEAAADYRLQLATSILQEAKRGQAASAQPAAAQETVDPSLVEAIQFGTPEQAAIALAKLGTKVKPEEVAAIAEQRARIAAQDEFHFQAAVNFAESEYKDIFANDYLKRLFYSEEKRRRAPVAQGGEGNTSAYKDLYKAIGDDLRKAFSPPVAPLSPTQESAPNPSVAKRAEAKAATPPVPRTAAARLQATEAAVKAPTTSEVIAAMSAKRGQNRLSQPTKGAS